MEIAEELILAVQIFVALLGAYLVAIWLSLTVWAYRDSRARSREVAVHIFSLLLVLIFNIPGILIYLLLRPPETLADRYERSLEEESILQELERPTACPSCKRAVQLDYIVCPHCRSRLRQGCPGCGRPLELSWRACPYCAVSLSREPAAEREEPVERVAETR